MIQLRLTNIQDEPTRGALESMRDSLNAQELLLADFRFFSIITTAAVTNMVFTHNLGFIPTDVILTRLSGGTVTWNYDSFTKDTVSLTTSAAVNLRFLLGRMAQ